MNEKLETARIAAMDAASLAQQAQGIVAGVQNATDGSADWMLPHALEALDNAQVRLDAAKRMLRETSR
jgi:hypothetical protein